MTERTNPMLLKLGSLLPQPSYEDMVAGSKVIRNTPYGLQDGNGVDVSLLIANLQLTPEQRLVRMFELSRRMLSDRQHAERIP